jgi:hypothetical protein
VRGGFLKVLDPLARGFVDMKQHGFQIFEHINRRNSQRENAVCGTPGIAPRIALRLVSAIMGLTVHFHAQLRLVAVKVEIVRPRRVLFAPVIAGLKAAQLLPQQNFGQSHFAAEGLRPAIGFASAFDHAFRSLSRFARPSVRLRLPPPRDKLGEELGNAYA